MSVEDAKKFCSDNRTKGSYLGNEYIFMFTNLKYLFEDADSEIIFKKDNGSRKEVINELGLTIYNK